MTAHALVRHAAALLAAAALMLAACAVASAGTYTVHSCQTPDGAPAPADGWSWSASDARLTGYVAACPTGGITLRLLPGVAHVKSAAANMRFSAPSSTDIVGYRFWRSMRRSPAERYFYSPTEALAGADEEWVMDRCGGWSNTCVGVGDPTVPLSAANLVDRVPPKPVARWGAYISCGLYKTDDPDCRATTPLAVETTIWRAETTLRDEVAPTFATPPAGSLLDGGTLGGVHRVSTIAADRGGGVASTALEVDGQVLDRETFGDPDGLCRVPYVRRVPCPATASGTLTLDTAQLADGAHQLRVLATDPANNTTAWGPVAFATDNAAAFCSPAAPPAGPAPQLRTWIGPAPRASRRAGRRRGRAAQARRRTVTVGLGSGARLEGELVDAGGAPIAGAGVCVSTRPSDDAPVVPLVRLTTDAAGHFGATVPAGTSRQVWAVHRAGGGTVATRAVVRVRPRVTLAPSRGRVRAGRVLTMRGTLSASPPGRPVLVNIQAKRGRSWQTFRQVRVGRSGRFRVRYRFVGGPGVRRYALRASVPAQGVYPYAPGSSRPFRVRVSG